LIKTKRLVLRDLEESDADRLVELYSVKDYYKHTTIPYPYDKEVALDFINAENDEIHLAVELDGEIIGGVGLRLNPKDNNAALGYTIAPDFVGKGYATEAAEALIKYGFNDLQLHRIEISCSVDNHASKKIIEKLGAKFEGCARGACITRKGHEDKLTYAILKDDKR